jgi:hypothetical protein
MNLRRIALTAIAAATLAVIPSTMKAQSPVSADSEADWQGYVQWLAGQDCSYQGGLVNSYFYGDNGWYYHADCANSTTLDFYWSNPPYGFLLLPGKNEIFFLRRKKEATFA